MKRPFLLLACLGALIPSALARTVTVGSFVCNPGAIVSVPIVVDDLADVGAALLTVNYDASVVVCLGVEAGAAVEAKSFVYADTTGAGQVVLSASSFAASRVR